MDINAQMEQFSIAYLKAIIAAAGFKHQEESVDDDSIDITIIGKGFTGGNFRNPKIDVQVKSTYRDCLTEEFLKYPLKKKNHDDLRGEDISSPRYLFVVKLPSDNPIDWLTTDDDNISLHNYCYWSSLRFHEATTNDHNVTIPIPVSQKLTPDSLRELMIKASQGVFI